MAFHVVEHPFKKLVPVITYVITVKTVPSSDSHFSVFLEVDWLMRNPSVNISPQEK